MATKQVCGAWAKSAGRPCEAPAMANGRCRHHGGVYTGQTSLAGHVRALRNLLPYRSKPLDDVLPELTRLARKRFPEAALEQVRASL